MSDFQKIFIIFHGRFPSEKAAAIFAGKSAESFAREGKKVVLLVPNRKDRLKDNPFSYYGIEKNFDLVYLPIINLFGFGFLKRFAFRISFVSFALSCVWYAFRNGKRGDIFYSNESVPLFALSFLFPNTCYEMHDFAEKNLFFYRWLFRRVKHILVHNKWKLQHLRKMMGDDVKKAFYEPNAVELSAFDIDISKEEARIKCGLPVTGKIAIYTGHLYSWKGVDTLARAAALLSPDINVVFVGGTDADIKKFSQEFSSIKNIKMAGHQPFTSIPVWQKAGDVVVLPNTAKEKISAFYTSPMKLFEYMASKRPIVASNISSIVEIVDDSSAFLCIPDDPRSLADAIARAIDDTALSEQKVYNAFVRVQEHTWGARAKRIFSHLIKSNV